MIKAAIFDLGNTLFDFLDFSVEAHSQRLGAAMLDIHRRLVAEGLVDASSSAPALARAVFADLMALEAVARAESTEYDVAAEIQRALARRFPAVDSSWIERIDAALFAVLRSEFAARPDAVDTLKALKAAGLKVGLLSNTQFRAELHAEDLREMGLAQWIDAMAFSVDVGVRKPRREIFDHALERLGVEAGEAVMVGDTLEADIAGAREAGLKTIAIRTPDNAAALAAGDHVADAVVDRLSEIPGVLSEWRKGR